MTVSPDREEENNENHPEYSKSLGTKGGETEDRQFKQIHFYFSHLLLIINR